LSKVQSLDEVRGHEGAASSLYYQAFRTFLSEDWEFEGRRRRPASDPVNALLSFGYTLLYKDILHAINVVGLDPYLGFLHAVKPGHASLVSDMVEEWRTIIVDSVVLSLLNGRMLTREDFVTSPDGSRLTRDGLIKYLQRFNARLNHVVYHKGREFRTSYGNCLELQVRQLAKVILGEETCYEPFRTR
jgi:CRISPR-associated protein Cas1